MKLNLNKPIILSAVIFSLLAGTVEGQSDNRSVEQRAAQTLINTIKGKKVKAPTPARIKEFREDATSDAGEAWAVTDQVKSTVDNKTISVTLKINQLPENYQTAPADAKKWNDILQTQRHGGTNAEIGFRVSQRGDVRRHRIYYRKQEGNIGLLMHVTRTGDESLEQAIEKTVKQFTKYYEFAKAEGLVGFGSKIDLVYLPDGGQVEINDEVQVIQAPDSQSEMDLEFDVAAFSPTIQPGQDYQVELKIESNNAGATFLGPDERGLRDSDRNGWQELTVRADSKGRFIIRLDQFAPQKDDPYGLEQLIVAAIRVRTNEPDATEPEFHSLRFGIQRRAWHVIAQRFELVPANYFRTDQKTRNSQGGVYDLDGRLGFNRLIGDSGKLMENYQQMLKTYGTPRGEISDSAPVGMGWERDHASRKSYEFHIATDAKGNEEKRITAIPVAHRTRCIVDLKIVRAPKRTTLPGNQTEQVDEFGDPIDSEESTEFDVLDQEMEVRKLISLDDYTLTRTLISDAPGEDEETFYRNLPKRLRQAPNPDERQVVRSFDADNSRESANIETHFPLTNRYRNPNSLPEFREPSMGTTGLLIETPHRFAAVYEMRFQANLLLDGEAPGLNEGEANDAKKHDIDIAFRYTVCPGSFKLMLLQWESERGRLVDE